MNEEIYAGIQPDIENPEETDHNVELRYKALLLLLIFLIPTLVILYELFTNQITGMWTETVQPYLPQLDQVVTF